jgi:hypothetical protein
MNMASIEKNKSCLNHGGTLKKYFTFFDICDLFVLIFYLR